MRLNEGFGGIVLLLGTLTLFHNERNAMQVVFRIDVLPLRGQWHVYDMRYNIGSDTQSSFGETNQLLLLGHII